MWWLADLDGSKPEVAATIEHRATALAFSADGRRLAVGMADGRIAIVKLPPPPGRARRPAREPARRAATMIEWLTRLARLAGQGGYRDGGVELVESEGRFAIDLPHPEGTVRVSAERAEGVRVVLSAMAPGWSGAPPPSSLIRFARWVRETFSPARRALEAADRSWAEALQPAGTVKVERAGGVLRLALVIDDEPDLEAVLSWARELRRRLSETGPRSSA